MAARSILLERGKDPAAAAAAAGSSHGLAGGSSYGKINGVGVQGYGKSNGVGVPNHGASLSIFGDKVIPQALRHKQSMFSGQQFTNTDSSAGRSCPPGLGGYLPRDDGVPLGHHPGPKAQAFVYDTCRRNGFNRHDLNWSGYTFHGDYGRQPTAVLDNVLCGGQPGHGGFNAGVGGWPGCSGTASRAPSFGGSGPKNCVFNGGRGTSGKGHASGSGGAAASHCAKGEGKWSYSS